MSPIQFLRILMARRFIILVSLITCVIVALAVARTLPYRFPAKARVLMDVVKPDPVTGLMINNQAARGYVKTQMELIQDYRVAGDVVDKLGWEKNPAVIALWQDETGGAGEFRRWGAQRIIENTNVDVVEGSNILEITYEAPNPEVAKQIVGLLRTAYIDASLRFRTDSAGRTADWYFEQSDRAQRALTAAEAAKAEFMAENNIVVGANGQEAESTKLQDLQAALMSARGGQVAAESQAALTASGSQIVDSLKLQLATLNDQIQAAGEKLGEQHPTYRALLTRRTTLQGELARETRESRSDGALRTGVSRRSVSQLDAEYRAQRAKVLGMQTKLNQLAQLQREVDLRRQQYEKAAARTADLRLESNVNESSLVVLGDAIGSGTPSFPNWPQIIGLSFAFGLALGVVLAVFTELLARRVRGTEDLGFVTKAPVFAVISSTKRVSLIDRLRQLARRQSGAAEPQPAQ